MTCMLWHRFVSPHFLCTYIGCSDELLCARQERGLYNMNGDAVIPRLFCLYTRSGELGKRLVKTIKKINVKKQVMLKNIIQTGREFICIMERNCFLLHRGVKKQTCYAAGRSKGDNYWRNHI